jgi:hypothetical protein
VTPELGELGEDLSRCHRVRRPPVRPLGRAYSDLVAIIGSPDLDQALISLRFVVLWLMVETVKDDAIR